MNTVEIICLVAGILVAGCFLTYLFLRIRRKKKECSLDETTKNIVEEKE